MNARPLAVMDSLRFGPLDGAEPDEALRRKNHQIVSGVVAGIAGYGNCFGVPNACGETRFEPCYSGNPLVNAFALGLARRDKIFYARAAGAGNPVIYVGAKTGRDGIHGATMASEEFSEESQQKRPNVQVGDPFLEKLLLEACIEAMESGAVVGIQDMGAAGLTCSTCEMGGRGGVGLEIELDQVPQRESGMTAYEIMLSESQERMLLVAEQGREQEVFRIFEKWGLDAVTIGQVIPENMMRVLHHGEVVAEIPNEALTDDAPVYQRPMERWEPELAREMPASVRLGERSDLTGDLKTLLASPNICSKRWIHEKYEAMVQTETVEGPGRDAGLIRVRGTQRALAMSLDCNGRWCYLDPKLGAEHAVAEAARNVACTGAMPVAATNCLNFGNPEKPHIMWQFAQVIDGMAAACEVLGTPITGGNVSFYNETLGEGIYPTPVVGIVGILEDIDYAMKPHFRQSGRDILLVSAASAGDADLADAQAEFGSSEYAKEILGELWGYPPSLDLKNEAALHKFLAEVASEGLIESAHDCSDAGIAVALAECGFAMEVGATIELPGGELPAEMVLFAEDATRIVISCDPRKTERIKQSGIEYGLSAEIIGRTAPGNLEISVNGQGAVSAGVSELKDIWERALPQMLHVESREHLVPELLQKS